MRISQQAKGERQGVSPPWRSGGKREIVRRLDDGEVTVILDFSEAEYFSSVLIAWLLGLQNKLKKRGLPFHHRRKRWELFAVFPDHVTALDAIRRGEHDALMLCGLRQELVDVLAVC